MMASWPAIAAACPNAPLGRGGVADNRWLWCSSFQPPGGRSNMSALPFSRPSTFQSGPPARIIELFIASENP